MKRKENSSMEAGKPVSKFGRIAMKAAECERRNWFADAIPLWCEAAKLAQLADNVTYCEARAEFCKHAEFIGWAYPAQGVNV